MPETAFHLTKSSRLCGDCLDQMRSHVARLPDLFRECEELLTGRRRSLIGRVTGRGVGGLCLNGAALSARADILTVAASWAGLIAQVQQLAVRPPRRIPDLTAFLLLHMDWLARHPAAAVAAAAFSKVVCTAKAALEPDEAQRVDLGKCDVPGCSGTLRVVFGGRSSGVFCDLGHERQASEWLSVARRATRRGMSGRRVRRA